MINYLAKPFYSIITPILNGEAYIEKYLESLNNQIFENWECLIIDDGSNDKSLEIISKNSKNDSRFKILKTPKIKKIVRSPYLARNQGLLFARGKYICFLDIDDYWLPSKLKDEYELIKKNKNISILIGEYFKADKNLNKGYLKPRIKFLPIKMQIKIWNPCPMLSTTIRRKDLGNIQFDPIFHEDYKFWHEVLSKISNDSIHINHYCNCIYRTTINSQSANKIKASRWLFKCYQSFNYSLIKSLLFLLIKIIAEIVEHIFVKVGILEIKNLKTKAI